MESGDLPIRLIHKETVAQKTLAATFELPSLPYSFEPGQAAVLSLSEGNAPGEGRTLSFASAPSELPQVTFATRIASGSSFKEALSQALPGDEFFLSSPFGEFLLPTGEEASFPLIFLAGGIGLTPFRSMLREFGRALAERAPLPPVLLTLNRTAEETPYHEECRQWNGSGIIRWVPVETRSPQSGGSSRDELVRQALEEILKQTGTEARLYLAGPPAMVDSLSEVLTASFGFPRERLTLDLFFGYA
ncbi:MAG: FAD-dependent oxidoreductase [Leptospirillia bacterium]